MASYSGDAESLMHNLLSLNAHYVIPRYLDARDYQAHCGMLTSPRNRKNPQGAIALGAKWAADNDCFMAFEPRRILNWLERNRHLAGSCLWFNAPDVVGNGRATLANFWYWREIIHGFGFPVCFTLQNGMEEQRVPFGMFEALFIGGTTQFKYSAYVREMVQEANRRGIWVHNGRVNTPERIIYSRLLGCDSFDGTNYTRDPRIIKRHLPYHAGAGQLPIAIFNR